ncbi:MAG: tRNA pseudouridine(55) synthase TruB [Synergistaceae bacterium]|nr:tRNA pseudouridine(55) synthase TruB [Synergistaceae bacterium]MBR0093912.1 tRNA pseudouridine(55) synthase TruB [Synergistaceae bacterium]
MNVLILINKPEGFRSSWCVGRARKRLPGLKVGHSGTLDSTASGLMVLLAGHATRFSEFVMSLPKVYRTVIQFGVETNTYDYSGDVVAEDGFEGFDEDFFRDSLFSFSGVRLQTPPAVSAIKIEGQPAYKLTRAGKDIDMKSRPVFFRNIKILTPFNPSDGTVELEVSCGRGTYIRSLAHDLGKLMGCGAHVKKLVRVSVGNFHIDNANKPEDKMYKFTKLSEFAKNFNRIYVSERDGKSFMNGMSILLRQAERCHRGVSVKGMICVEGEKFLGFGSYAGYDYIKPEVIVPKA